MKTDGVNLEKNIAITSASEIKEICSPLEKYFDVTFFNYVKLFKDGSRYVLTNNIDFTKAYYKDRKLYQTKAVLSMEQLQTTCVHLFCEFQDQPSFTVARNEFNIDNGITIIQPSISESATELFYFATKTENYKHIYLYTTHLDAFHRFIVYFKEKAIHLIKQANEEKFSIDTPKIETIIPSSESNKLLNFYTEIEIDKLHVKLGNIETALSKREIDCLCLSMRNKTAKEIGKILSISPRTVETYLSNLKLKSDCQTKQELMSKFAPAWRPFLISHSLDMLKS